MKPLSYVSGPLADQVNAAITGNLKNVARWSSPVEVSSTGLGAAVYVQHDLSAVPNVIRVEPQIDSRWWADRDDRALWTNAVIVFRAAHAGLFTVRAGVQ